MMFSPNLVQQYKDVFHYRYLTYNYEYFDLLFVALLMLFDEFVSQKHLH